MATGERVIWVAYLGEDGPAATRRSVVVRSFRARFTLRRIFPLLRPTPGCAERLPCRLNAFCNRSQLDPIALSDGRALYHDAVGCATSFLGETSAEAVARLRKALSDHVAITRRRLDESVRLSLEASYLLREGV